MENLKNWCEGVANRKFTMTGTKISQRERNALKREFVGVFVSHLQNALNSDLITVVETQKGIGIAIDNENIGFIPIEIVPTFKDTECDIVDLAEEYVEHKAQAEEKAKAKEKAKAEKIARDKAEREKKATQQKENQNTNGQDLDDFE